MYRSVMLNYFNRNNNLKGTSIKQLLCSHLKQLLSPIQDGWTALKVASFKGHQRVVELLLEAGANPDLQNKVRARHMHANLSNGKSYILPVKSLLNFIRIILIQHLTIPHLYTYISFTLVKNDACLQSLNIIQISHTVLVFPFI